MRVSSLSDDRVRDVLSRYFIPVYLSRDSYEPTPADRDELVRIDRECKRRGLDGGAVCAFVIASDGQVLASLRVQKASQPEQLVPFLNGVIERTGVKPGEIPKDLRRNPSELKPPAVGSLALKVWTRLDGPRAKYGLSEDRIVLSAGQLKAFLPPADRREACRWTVESAAIETLLRHFYPPGPNWRVQDSSIVRQQTTVAWTPGADPEQTVVLQTELVLNHRYGRNAPGRIEATLTGILHFDRERRQITSFEMVSTTARFTFEWQGKEQSEAMSIAVEMEK